MGLGEENRELGRDGRDGQSCKLGKDCLSRWPENGRWEGLAVGNSRTRSVRSKNNKTGKGTLSVTQKQGDTTEGSAGHNRPDHGWGPSSAEKGQAGGRGGTLTQADVEAWSRRHGWRLASPLGACAAVVPRSLPPMPVPGTGTPWYRVGRQGLEERSPLVQGSRPGSAGSGFYPARAWIPARGSGATSKRAGRGRDRSQGAPPAFQPASPSRPCWRAGDPEGLRLLGSPLPLQVLPFRVGPPCLQQQQPSSPVSSRRSLGRLLAPHHVRLPSHGWGGRLVCTGGRLWWA